MMMFAMAVALLITGGALGTPWLTGVFGEAQHVSSANEAGVICPPVLVGLTLVAGNEVRARGDVFTLDCEYSLAPSKTVSAVVSISWTEDGPNQTLQAGCGLPPTVVHGVFDVEGSYYGFSGQVRANYSGQTRYSNAMQSLSSQLVKAASTIAEPCPGQVGVNLPGIEGGTDGLIDPGGEGNGSVGQGSAGSENGSGSTGDGGEGDPTATLATVTVVAATSVPGQAATLPDEVPAGSCMVSGRVTDSRGIPVPHIQLQVLAADGSVAGSTSSERSGAYRLAEPHAAGGTVVLTPLDTGHGQAFFQVHVRQQPVSLSRQVELAAPSDMTCEVNFDLWDIDDSYMATGTSIDRWPSIIELYQNFNRAAELAIDVGAPLDYGLPVPVYAWCDSAALFCDPAGSAEFAFYSGTTTGRQVDQPYIALGFPSSQIDYRGTPDNREYHEFGHAFLADVTGNQIPVNIGDQNHGGYFRNQLTTDSYIEGFAEFYSVMVSKHVDSAESPQRYRIGAEYDIEADRKPWEAVGWWEEFTLAGLLLDFEDGPEDYATPARTLDVETVSALNASTGNFAIGRVRNLGASTARSPEVTVNLLNDAGEPVFTQVTAVKPDSLGPGQTGVFYVAAPDGIEFSQVDAAPGRPASMDDDEIDLDLVHLLQVITGDWGSESGSIVNVRDLYLRLSEVYAGNDVDGDGEIDATQDAIDAIFIKHGFFDDIDGDRAWNPAVDGEIGGTSHPAARIGSNEFPGITPRASAVGFEGSFVDVNTAGVDADLLVQVELADASGTYAYWSRSGTLGPVELAVPGADAERGAVTVIAAADGRVPAVAFRTTSRQFHAAVESGEITSQPVVAQIEMQEGNPLALLEGPGGDGGDSSRAGIPPWATLVPVILAILMLVGGFYLMRRTDGAKQR